MEDPEMKLDFIIAYQARYLFGHEKDFVPPITGIHMAAITPGWVEFRLFHQQIDVIQMDTEADLIAISCFSGFAPAAYQLAQKFRSIGKTVIGGGPHVSFCQDEALQYFDAIVTGEAESCWIQMLEDFRDHRLERIYRGEPTNLQNIPTPRYDMLSDRFFIRKVVQATRGCPFACSFCTVPALNPGFRFRPVSDVIRDIRYDHFKHWWQNKIVWFWDDNLTIDRKYIQELLSAMIPLKKWWLTQASMDIARDEKLLDLMKASGCIGVFLGIESFGVDSLADANKKQNTLQDYKQAIQAIHKRGIAVMAGFIAGFDHDTPETIKNMATYLQSAGIDVPFISILTPFNGTPLHERLQSGNRILADRGWEFYNGYNVAFRPARMTPEELLTAHRELWKKAFSFRSALGRILKGIFYLRFGAFCMVLFMNTFYGVKHLRGNFPLEMRVR